MVKLPAPSIPPVLVLGTGRCGSTMVSNLLNAHPRIPSLSEFFSYVGMDAFRLRNPTGDRMWEIYSRQRDRTRLMPQESYEELLYPIDGPVDRFTRHDVPPILCATLPHLTDQYEALYDELESFVRAQPKQPPVAHIRSLFAHLCERFSCSVWVERSGLTLLVGSRLLRKFPEVRVIHIYRDGRETAISMSRHHLFRMIAATFKRLRMFRMFLATMPLMSRGGGSENIVSLMEAFHSQAGQLWETAIRQAEGRRLCGLLERADRCRRQDAERTFARPPVEPQIRRHAGGARSPYPATYPLHRPHPGRRGVDSQGVHYSAPNAIEVLDAQC